MNRWSTSSRPPQGFAIPRCMPPVSPDKVVAPVPCHAGEISIEVRSQRTKKGIPCIWLKGCQDSQRIIAGCMRIQLYQAIAIGSYRFRSLSSICLLLPFITGTPFVGRKYQRDPGFTSPSLWSLWSLFIVRCLSETAVFLF